MSHSKKLLTAVVLGALVTFSSGAAADAKVVKHKAPPAPPAATAAEVAELRAEVQALKDLLATQAQAQQQTQATAQQAQAAAASAKAQAQAVQAKAEQDIQTIPAQVKTAVAAAKPKPGWEAATSVNGRMYFDLTNIEQKKDGAKVPATGSSLDIKRFYIGVDHKFSDVFSANFTTDVAYVSADSLTQVYLKKAYLQAKVSDGLILLVGSADLPWVPFAEDV